MSGLGLQGGRTGLGLHLGHLLSADSHCKSAQVLSPLAPYPHSSDAANLARGFPAALLLSNRLLPAASLPPLHHTHSCVHKGDDGAAGVASAAGWCQA